MRLHYALPSYSTLERLVRGERSKAHHKIYKSIENQLSDLEKSCLDAFLEVAKDENKSDFTKLKEYPGPGHISQIRLWVERWDTLSQGVKTEVFFSSIPFTKIHEFASQAYTLELSDMQKIENKGRQYVLLMSLIHCKKMDTKDELARMFIRRVRNTHTKAKTKLEKLQQDQKELKDEMLKLLKEIVKTAKNEPKPEPLGNRLLDLLKQKGGIDYVEDCTYMLSDASEDNYFPLLWKIHVSYRKALLDILEILTIESATQDNELLHCLELYFSFRYSHKSFIENINFPLGFASVRWKQTILTKNNGLAVYDRRMLELCLLYYISEGLQSTDLFFSQSFDYGDYRSNMLSDKKVAEELDSYCKKVEIPSNPNEFVNQLKRELSHAIEDFDDNIEANEFVYIDKNGTIRNRKIKTLKPTVDIKKFKVEVAQKMSPSSVLDILNKVNEWSNFTRNFYPTTGNNPKSASTLLHHIYTVFAYGSNLGPAQTEKHTSQPVSRRSMSKINFQHIDARKLQNAITDTVNQYSFFDITQYWGKKDSAAADGTHVELSENNLMGERHIRYGGYGGIAYHHISDTYVALFSHFIACGTWEAVYILDGLMMNKSRINPNKIHADTQGQNEPAFGLSYLLGIELMPRIRNFRDMNLYSDSKNVEYKNLKNLFKKAIDWDLIRMHWHDLMQVSVSIHKGKVLPSMILKKLGIHGKKTKLYKAFRELGRVRKTIFLIRFMQDNNFQSTIHQATCKIESYNSFCDWITFGGEHIMTGDPIEQEKRIKYTSLIANNIMLYNTQELTKVINQFRKEGKLVSDEEIKSLSPYLREHILRFGEYVLNIDLKIEPMDFKIV